MHAISTLGCAAAVAPLALQTSPDPYLACAWLVGVQCCYAASFGGFHAYVQVGAVPTGVVPGCKERLRSFGKNLTPLAACIVQCLHLPGAKHSFAAMLHAVRVVCSSGAC